MMKIILFFQTLQWHRLFIVKRHIELFLICLDLYLLLWNTNTICWYKMAPRYTKNSSKVEPEPSSNQVNSRVDIALLNYSRRYNICSISIYSMVICSSSICSIKSFALSSHLLYTSFVLYVICSIFNLLYD